MSTPLLNTILERPPANNRAPCIPLGELLTSLTRSHYVQATPVRPARTDERDLMVLGSRQIEAYAIHPGDRWVDYAGIKQAFVDRRREAKEQNAPVSNATPLPEQVARAPLKILIPDTTLPVQAVVTTEAVYPTRAWVAVVRETLPVEAVYIIAGLLNSALGQALYRQRAGVAGKHGRELRQKALFSIPFPITLLIDPLSETVQRAARLSYRLHGLYAAKQECGLGCDLDEGEIRSHWEALLSDLVRMYGISEERVQKLITEELKDVPGTQESLFYRPTAPLLDVRLLDGEALEAYEALKARSRSGEIDDAGKRELARVRRLLYWQNRINGPLPQMTAPGAWPGVTSEIQASKAAALWLSSRYGHAFTIADVRREDPETWTVSYLLPEHDRELFPKLETADGTHVFPVRTGHIRIDAVSGAVQSVAKNPADARPA